ncbi:MAG TPA: hypothetical protein PKE40_13890 [Arachnia sp.]|nr:hypothetical protein [Arachnia sp.]HMT87435.1 hypothetical protein [Arachnia sp.]
MAEAPNRRQVLAAGAWSVPVIGLASAVPVAAATTVPSLYLVLDFVPYDPENDWLPPAPGEAYDAPVVVLVQDVNGNPVAGISVVFTLTSGASFYAADGGTTSQVADSEGDGSALATDIYVDTDTPSGPNAVTLTASTAGAQTLVILLDVS